MSEDVLFHRVMPHGPSVRIRRTSGIGVTPVALVLEIDRRAGTPREGQGTPPALAHSEAATEGEAMAALEPQARDDRRVIQLLRAKGLR